jgi:serpin B
MALRVAALLVIVAAALIGCTDGSADRSGPRPTDSAPGEPRVPAEDLKALVEGNNAFAIDLYKKLAEKEAGNIVISPYSISTALAMTYAGARGKTADEMRKVLHFTLPDEKLHASSGGIADY